MGMGWHQKHEDKDNEFAKNSNKQNSHELAVIHKGANQGTSKKNVREREFLVLLHEFI